MKQLSFLVLFAAAGSLAMASTPPSTSSPCATTAERFPSAADYRREFVPADASMVMHLDLKNLRASQLGQALMKQRHEIEIDGLDELIETLGFDPLKEVDSITAYSSSDDEENFGAILVATEAIDRALEKLPEQEGYRSLSKGGIDFFAFDDLVGSWHIMDSGERLVMVGKTVEVALRGHQVIHGDIPSQRSDSDRALLPRPNPGAIVFLAGRGEVLKQHDRGLGSALTEMVKGAQFELAEADGSMHLRLGVLTDSSEEARDLKEMLGGFMALGRMFLASDDDLPQDLAGLLRAVNVRIEGNAINLSLSVPLKQAMGLVHSIKR